MQLKITKSTVYLALLVLIAEIAGGFIYIHALQYKLEARALYQAEAKATDNLVAQLKTKSDPTSDWQTYRNEEYGFEFRYPPNGRIEVIKMLEISDIILYLDIYYGKSKSYLFLKKNNKQLGLKDFILEPYRNCISGFDSECLSPSEIENLSFESFNLDAINGLKDGFTYFFTAPDRNDIVYISHPTQVMPGDENILPKILSTLTFIDQ